jgi:RNA polymerase sigma-70 factor, ECF subfamily
MSPDQEFGAITAPYRRELTAHCYRMLGSFQDAEDLVQETYLRAWRGFGGFEGRASVRTWLYQIATRACLTALQGRERRVLPAGLGGPAGPGRPAAAHLESVSWLQPLPDAAAGADPADPANVVALRESTRLAFAAALQYLSARQRAVLLLRDVLGWTARETADLLGMTSVASNSALQRARERMAALTPDPDDIVPDAAAERQVLERYLSAFERADVDALARLLRRDAELQMPPVPTWFAGRDAITGFYASRVFRRGTWRGLPTRANGYPAVASYLTAGDGVPRAHSIQVIETSAGLITGIHVWIDPGLFPGFGLPGRLADARSAFRSGS